jgi:4a-hydroxytetrahydrobiopterin dehydratase
MWIEQNDKLTASYRFKDFREAFVFMTKVAEVAEGMNHHPWWSNSYNEVNFELSTHSAGNKVTDKDFELAKAIDAIYDQAE